MQSEGVDFPINFLMLQPDNKIWLGKYYNIVLSLSNKAKIADHNLPALFTIF
jgi:hypothetical protein